MVKKGENIMKWWEILVTALFTFFIGLFIASVTVIKDK
jgi:hypothetical protein